MRPFSFFLCMKGPNFFICFKQKKLCPSHTPFIKWLVTPLSVQGGGCELFLKLSLSFRTVFSALEQKDWFLFSRISILFSRICLDRRDEEAVGRFLPDGQHQPRLPHHGQVRHCRQATARKQIRKVIKIHKKHIYKLIPQ